MPAKRRQSLKQTEFSLLTAEMVVDSPIFVKIENRIGELLALKKWLNYVTSRSPFQTQLVYDSGKFLGFSFQSSKYNIRAISDYAGKEIVR